MSRVVEALAGLKTRPSPGWLIACSGGADSTALAIAAVEAGLSNLVIAHVHHHLRGEESDQDARFVEALARQLNVEFQISHWTIDGDSAIEERAREARYEWLHSIAEGRMILTAHTADDHAETILHRIIRGTGLTGLSGMADRPGIARPFLHLKKTELVDYLTSKEHTWRTDSSNDDCRFTRNRIRHELMPLLRKINPQVEQALMSLAEQAREYVHVVRQLAADWLRQAEKPRVGTTVILSRDTLAAAEMLIAREGLRLLWDREGWPSGDMTARHWRQLAHGESGHYPGGVRVERAEKVVRITRSE